MSEPNDNGIYYFLGNTTSHILHALPLYRELGGTFIVLSEKARKKLSTLYDVPVIALDNVPYQWYRFSYKIKPIHEYSRIDHRHKKTVDFLNKNARVVLFYDLFDFDASVRIQGPKTVFLTHGNMLKDYMGESDRLRKVKQYDYMAALGPYLKQKLLRYDIPKSKLVDLGIARTDDVVKHQGEVAISQQLAGTLKLDINKPVISYLPTFWGASSIYTTGLEIIHNFPADYTLLFRPHPSTPTKILRKYLKIIRTRDNIYYLPEGKYKDISLIDIFDSSSVIIGDVSSIMLEAILSKKPLIFAHDIGEHSQTGAEYSSIKGVVKHSGRIDMINIEALETIIKHCVADKPDDYVWDTIIAQNFYHADGTSVTAIKEFIAGL